MLKSLLSLLANFCGPATRAAADQDADILRAVIAEEARQLNSGDVACLSPFVADSTFQLLRPEQRRSGSQAPDPPPVSGERSGDLNIVTRFTPKPHTVGTLPWFIVDPQTRRTRHRLRSSDRLFEAIVQFGEDARAARPSNVLPVAVPAAWLRRPYRLCDQRWVGGQPTLTLMRPAVRGDHAVVYANFECVLCSHSTFYVLHRSSRGWQIVAEATPSVS